MHIEWQKNVRVLAAELWIRNSELRIRPDPDHVAV